MGRREREREHEDLQYSRLSLRQIRREHAVRGQSRSGMRCVGGHPVLPACLLCPGQHRPSDTHAFSEPIFAYRELRLNLGSTPFIEGYFEVLCEFDGGEVGG